MKKITKKEYESALKIVNQYKKQIEEQKKSVECTHYYINWNSQENRYICPDCGHKGPVSNK